MSRLGKSPVPLPKGVELTASPEGVVHVKGPKGTLSHTFAFGIRMKVEDGFVLVEKDDNVDMHKAVHGLSRALINNMILGVSKGFEKRLSLVGVGYRAALQGRVLDLQLGYSHPTKLPIPDNVQVAVEKSILIIVSGSDKQAVGQFAATVRAMRPPEPYKGKGIRYENEYVRKKAGKAAKGKGS